MRTTLKFFSGAFYLKIWLLTQTGIILDGELSLAQNNVRSGRRLPPPPAVRQPTRRNDVPSGPDCSRCSRAVSSPTVSRSKPLKEYVYRAPYPVRPAGVTVVNNSRPPAVSNRPLPPRQEQQRRVIAGNMLFRVEVKAYGPEALERIRTIEPMAFMRLGENVIQAGLFQQAQQATQRVRELNSRGFQAHVITLNAQRF